MIMTDFYNICVDKPLIHAIDKWASRSAFQPSRRQSVHALLRIGLKHVTRHEYQKKAEAAPAPEQTTVAS
jgi:hypothetical protein